MIPSELGVKPPAFAITISSILGSPFLLAPKPPATPSFKLVNGEFKMVPVGTGFGHGGMSVFFLCDGDGDDLPYKMRRKGEDEEEKSAEKRKGEKHKGSLFFSTCTHPDLSRRLVVAEERKGRLQTRG
ncbi:hypothetical protein DKX38_010915 [Salix brachista]|uniref:Uncharacterized protein n=1 Tax=Salix brachista TaxID=2182728 RepID=A0A5N5LXS8_9ROSI|nr:hypothetical protein DKX38_010915 [Salix brachista]